MTITTGPILILFQIIIINASSGISFLSLYANGGQMLYMSFLSLILHRL